MLTEAPEATRKNLRSFGLVGGLILVFFAFMSWRKGGAACPYFLGAGSLAALAALTVPMALKPIFAGWMKVAGVIAAINTFLLMGIVFYLFLTPYALYAWLTGKDLLDEKLNTGASYWHNREPTTDPKAYERQF